MGGFGGINELTLRSACQIRSHHDLASGDFSYEFQWGVYEGGVYNIDRIESAYLAIYVSSIYLFADVARPMSGECDFLVMMLLLKRVLNSGDAVLIFLVSEFLEALYLDAREGEPSYCLGMTFLLICLCLDDCLRAVAVSCELAGRGLVIEDVVDVTLYEHSILEGVLRGVVSSVSVRKCWGLCSGAVVESLYLNFDVDVSS